MGNSEVYNIILNFLNRKKLFRNRKLLQLKQLINPIKNLIFDMLGRQVKRINFSGKQLALERGQIKPGMYFVNIFGEGNGTVNRKILLKYKSTDFSIRLINCKQALVLTHAVELQLCRAQCLTHCRAGLISQIIG